MPYPEALVQPMRQELTRLGVQELKTADEVDAVFDEAADDIRQWLASVRPATLNVAGPRASKVASSAARHTNSSVCLAGLDTPDADAGRRLRQTAGGDDDEIGSTAKIFHATEFGSLTAPQSPALMEQLRRLGPRVSEALLGLQPGALYLRKKQLGNPPEPGPSTASS